VIEEPAAEIEFRQAVRDAIDDQMSRDPSVVLLGEDVGIAGGVFQATRGLYEKHGPGRVIDTPISELALAGAGFGSAIAGLRPIVEIMFGDFLPLAMDSIINQAAKYWFVSNEQQSVPLVLRSAVGAGGGFGAIHSQVPTAWFLSVPGLKIVAPATVSDAKALLIASIRDENPVLFLEHKRLYGLRGRVHDEVGRLGEARIVQPGNDATIVTVMRGVHDALRAAELLQQSRGITVEVVDLRTLRPLDMPVVLASVLRTKHLLVVEEGPRTGGWGAEVIAQVAEAGLGITALRRLTCPDLPLPYSTRLEDSFMPSRDSIAETISALVGDTGGTHT
jgi:pyruvate/2-oxoglutarate/acetoin dehydrogenase E1 component